MSWQRKISEFDNGLPVDIVVYALSAGFAGVTAATSTLAPHRAWAAVAVFGYIGATMLALAQLTLGELGGGRRRGEAATGAPRTLGVGRWTGAGARAAVAVAAFATTAVLPLVIQAAQRAAGRTDRAQEEVLVIEEGARRLLDSGTPYLGRSAIALLDQPLLGYLPYQPGMALFGLPRAMFGVAWWTDARLYFLAALAGSLALALHLLFHAGVAPGWLVRALQVATVLPICALTLATGGDDLPVLGFCLLGLALAAVGRFGWAGVALGAAAALKLFAWPVAVVLFVPALLARRGWVFAAGAAGIPLATALPALLVDRDALVENVLAFPFGRGLVTSPAASPLPGHLLATGVPGGRVIVYALLGLAVAGFAFHLVRRPPATAAQAALVAGLGLLLAMLLLPATRFGYLLYPVALLVWVPALTVPLPAPPPKIGVIMNSRS